MCLRTRSRWPRLSLTGIPVQDVYTGIANLVRARMTKDAEGGKHAAFAAAMVDAVDRKLVKQTVMTSVYGVTHVGAREQISSRLRERKWSMNSNSLSLFKATNYAAQVLFIYFRGAKLDYSTVKQFQAIILDEKDCDCTKAVQLPSSEAFGRQGMKFCWSLSLGRFKLPKCCLSGLYGR